LQWYRVTEDFAVVSGPVFVSLSCPVPPEAERTAYVPGDGQAFPDNGQIKWQVVLYVLPQAFFSR